jgi:hypothetical protein
LTGIRKAAIRAFPRRFTDEDEMKTARSIIIAFSLSLLMTACAQRAPVKAPKAVAAPTATPAREERLVIAYEGEDGKTALELLKSRARVRTITSSLGELVEGINGVSSGDGHNLIYFVNGSMAKTGAGSYVTKTGDRIEWKLIGPRKNK